ncbi:MAG: hypothetical protein U0350_43510 [Caldilineaceae bacterium]
MTNMMDKPSEQRQSTPPLEWPKPEASKAVADDEEIDLNELAKRIYALLREELRITRERLG